MEMSYQKYFYAIEITISLKVVMFIDHFTLKINFFEITFFFFFSF